MARNTIEEQLESLGEIQQQGLVWISHLAAHLVRYDKMQERMDAILKDHDTMLREIKGTQRDIARLLTRLVERGETNGTG